MPAEDRAPERWRYKEQTRMKHAVLSNYLTRWGSILRKPWTDEPQTLYYVDSFAGRGRYEGGEPGSPLRAMEVGQELHDHFNGEVLFDCHNVERDEENYESLEREVDACRSAYPDVSVTNYPGNVEDNVDDILQKIPKGAATIYFLDPWGYQSIDMVVRLLERRYNEVIVTFMSSFWNRFLGDETKASSHDRYLDTEEWRELLNSPNRQQKFVKFYGRQIQRQAHKKLGLNEIYVYPIDVDFGVEPSYLVDRKKPPSLDAELMEGLRGETTREITREVLRLPERERRLVLGIVRQFAKPVRH